MTAKALFVRLEAKPGKENEVAKFLRDGQGLVQQEPATTAWFGIKLGPTTFAIFDAFPDDAGRDAHLSGKVAKVLMEKAPDLLAQPPKIEKADVLADKFAGLTLLRTEGVGRVGAQNIMTSIRPLVLGLFLLTFLLSAVSGQISEAPKTYRARRLRPSDEGQQDPSFHAFRQKLLEAISRKDAEFLLSIVDPNIQISFGGEEGIRAFREVWKPEDVNSEVWNTLAQLLRLGGTFEESKSEFWAPYVFSRFPDDYGGFDFSAILARDVRVRSEPNDKAPMITSLSYDIVLNLSGSDSPEPKNKADSAWVRIRLPDGREGFVSAQFIRSPTDYRAGFKKTGGKWLLTHLVAGD